MSGAQFVTEIVAVLANGGSSTFTLPPPSSVIASLQSQPTPVCDLESADCNGELPSSIASSTASFQTMDIAPDATASASGTVLSDITGPSQTTVSSLQTSTEAASKESNLLGPAIGTFVIICVVLIGGLWFLLARRNKAMKNKNDLEAAKSTPYPFAIGIEGNKSGAGGDTAPEKEPDEKQDEGKARESDGRHAEELASLPTLAKHVRNLS